MSSFSTSTQPASISNNNQHSHNNISTHTSSNNNLHNPDWGTRAPITIVTSEAIQGVEGRTRPMIVLLDSGSTNSWIARDALPQGINSTTTVPYSGSTMAGTFSSNQQVRLDGIAFPEFYKHRRLPTMACRVMNVPCHYDIIIGRDVLEQIGIIVNFNEMIAIV